MSSPKNLCFANIIKGVNKQRKVYYNLALYVSSVKVKKPVVFRTLYLSEFDSYIAQDIVGIGTDIKQNDNIQARVVRGVSQKGNVYYLFQVLVNVDSEWVEFKKMLISPLERITLIKRFDFDLTDIDTIDYEEESEETKD